jgi:hypothetical protein
MPVNMSLIAFGVSNSLLIHWQYRWSPQKLRIFSKSAGQALMTLADAKPGTHASYELQKAILLALKLKFFP